MADQTGSQSPASAAPVLSLFRATGPVPIREVEGGWLLDLGRVEAGTLLPTFRFGILNAAEPPADALTVRFAVDADPPLRPFVPAAFEGMGPRSGMGEVDVILDASLPGVHVATITLHPERIAADGSVTRMPARVLTIREEVVGTMDAAPVPAGTYVASLPADQLLTTPVTLDGRDFARIQNLGSWWDSGVLEIAPDLATASRVGDAWLLATFETVMADFSAAGPGKTINVVGAESGRLALAPGDTALWSFISGGTAGGATIFTQGQATLRLTALGADSLDDRIGVTSLLPYAIYPDSVPRGNSVYDGRLSTATVVLGGWSNTVTAEAAVNLTVEGGSGLNHVVSGGGTNLIALDGIGDWIELGTGQTTIVQRAGSVMGDRITGFRTGDLIRFEGFGPKAALEELGNGLYRVLDGAGHDEAFWVEGIGRLVAGRDYVFG